MRVEKEYFKAHKTVNFDSPIHEHIAWLHKHVTGEHYLQQKPINGIARPIHGTADMARVALLSKIVMECYRRHGDKEAILITERDLKFIEIFSEWHDSGREHDGKDKWDKDSAVNVYYYLTLVLGISHQEAKRCAEAVSNKDAQNKFYELTFNEKNEIIWIESHRKSKNIYEKILHDADCFDIIRARPVFDARQLDFYKQFLGNKKSFSANHPVLNEIAYLRIEIASVIEYQGDGWQRLNFDIKKTHESEYAYKLVENDIQVKHYHLLPILYNHNILIPLDVVLRLNLLDIEKPDLNPENISEDNFNCWMQAGKLLARGIPVPSCAIKKKRKDDTVETAAELEIRKVMRRKGIATTSSKNDKCDKEGNPCRSASLIGLGSGIFCDAGFLIKLEDPSTLMYVNEKDIGTGFQKKHKISSALIYKNSTINIKNKLDKLIKSLKIGNIDHSVDTGRGYVDKHTECILDVTKLDAVYYTLDPSHYNYFAYKNNGSPNNSISPILQAAFLLKTYEKMTNGKKLPLFEYSWKHNRLIEHKFTNQQIILFHINACINYLDKTLNDPEGNIISHLSIEDIKVLSIYGTLENYYNQYNNIYGYILSTDHNCSTELIKQINIGIQTQKENLLFRYFAKMLSQIRENFFSQEGLKYLLHNPPILKNSATVNLIHEECRKIVEKIGSAHLLSIITDIISKPPYWYYFNDKKTNYFVNYANVNIEQYLYGGAYYDPKFNKVLLNYLTASAYFIAKHLKFEDILEIFKKSLVDVIDSLQIDLESISNTDDGDEIFNYLYSFLSRCLTLHIFHPQDYIKNAAFTHIKTMIKKWILICCDTKSKYELRCASLLLLESLKMLDTVTINCELLFKAKLCKNDISCFIQYALNQSKTFPHMVKFFKKIFLNPFRANTYYIDRLSFDQLLKLGDVSPHLGLFSDKNFLLAYLTSPILNPATYKAEDYVKHLFELVNKINFQFSVSGIEDFTNDHINVVKDSVEVKIFEYIESQLLAIQNIKCDLFSHYDVEKIRKLITQIGEGIESLFAIKEKLLNNDYQNGFCYIVCYQIVGRLMTLIDQSEFFTSILDGLYHRLFYETANHRQLIDQAKRVIKDYEPFYLSKNDKHKLDKLTLFADRSPALFFTYVNQTRPKAFIGCNNYSEPISKPQLMYTVDCALDLDDILFISDKQFIARSQRKSWYLYTMSENSSEPIKSKYLAHSSYGCFCVPQDKIILFACKTNAFLLDPVTTMTTNFKQPKDDITMSLPFEILDIASYSEGDLLITTSNDYTIRVWNIETGDCLTILTAPDVSVYNQYAFAIGVNKNKKQLIVVSADIICIWDLISLKCVQKLNHNEVLYSAQIAPNGEFILLNLKRSDDYCVFDMSAQAVKTTIKSGHYRGFFDCPFIISSDSKTLMATKRISNPLTSFIKLWDIQTGKLLYTLQIDALKVISTAFDQEGNILFATEDGKIYQQKFEPLGEKLENDSCTVTL